MTLTVAIVGRPNVGKSTLFNRLVGRRVALVDAQPGVTRDWREGAGNLGLIEFRVLDTAGLEDATGNSLEARIRRQTEAAVDEADVAFMLVDARVGVTPADAELAGRLRKRATAVIVVANKCESAKAEAGILEAYVLGLGEPVAISAEHGEGMHRLCDALEAHIAAEADVSGESAEEIEVEAAAEDEILRLAVVGRPNVGKSTLVNRLMGKERVLTGPESGITRDSVTIDWHTDGRRIRLIDTAGLRRKAKVDDRLEQLSVADALRAIRLAHVVVLLMDGQAALERQDLALARLAIEEGRALVIAVNKWDLVADRAATLVGMADQLQDSLAQARGVALVTLSALTGEGVEGLLPQVIETYSRWTARIATGRLNRWLAEAVARHPPPLVRGRRIRLRYITQAKARPPTFVLFASRTKEVPDSYLRYLVNDLRETFALPGTPIRVLLRRATNPYARAG